MFPTKGCDSGVTYSTGKMQQCRLLTAGWEMGMGGSCCCSSGTDCIPEAASPWVVRICGDAQVGHARPPWLEWREPFLTVPQAIKTGCMSWNTWPGICQCYHLLLQGYVPHKCWWTSPFLCQPSSEEISCSWKIWGCLWKCWYNTSFATKHFCAVSQFLKLNGKQKISRIILFIFVEII